MHLKDTLLKNGNLCLYLCLYVAMNLIEMENSDLRNFAISQVAHLRHNNIFKCAMFEIEFARLECFLSLCENFLNY